MGLCQKDAHALKNSRHPLPQIRPLLEGRLPDWLEVRWYASKEEASDDGAMCNAQEFKVDAGWN